MGSIKKEIDQECLPFVRVYKDGTVERLQGSPIVPPSTKDPETGVSSKDVTISLDPPISARLYLPTTTTTYSNRKLPILVYFHGGAFCIESAFSLVETKFMNSLASEAKIVAISIEYRLAPESLLPIAYEDCWAGLQWVASHFNGDGKDPWIKIFGDFNRVFIGGDSAGGNIVHNIAMRAGYEDLQGGVKLVGAILTHPYFWGSKPIEPDQSTAEHEQSVGSRVWKFVSRASLDDPAVNPLAPEARSLAGLGCRRLFISVAELDMLKARGILYYNAVKESGFEEVELIHIDGEHHAFHILNYGTESSKNLTKRLALFLSS
ncbi:hypothetical protein ACFE04_006221 [Oxalis oulophora]